jgi:indole-3-glycerol phosphate synthase
MPLFVSLDKPVNPKWKYLMENDFLNKIIERKKEEITEAKTRISQSELRGRALAVQKKRSFFQRLKQPGINIIAEIKRASPSKGSIKRNLDPIQLAMAYEKGGAAALSVLTEKDFFKGSFEDLKLARNATSLPVLRKDFIISEYQIYESSIWKADAVLLIVRCLSKNQLSDLIALSSELKMDSLVEIHTENDLETASEAGAQLIGINNRNLQTFKTDLNIALRLVSLLKNFQTPVVASGIQNRDDIEKNLNFGLNNFLIGESLVKAPDPISFLLKLKGL